MGQFRFLTAGESHGKGLTMVIEGVPSGLALSEADIAPDLARRQGGYGRGGRMKIEKDHAEIMSGVRHGLTLGTPIALWVQNRDWVNWTEKMAVEPVETEIERVTRMRPGHADLPGAIKYGFDDVRNVLERAIVLGNRSTIGVEDLKLSTLGNPSKAPDESSIDRHVDSPFEPISLSELEQRHIIDMLEHCGGNKTKAAQKLGIERSTLDRKLKRYLD